MGYGYGGSQTEGEGMAERERERERGSFFHIILYVNCFGGTVFYICIVCRV